MYQASDVFGFRSKGYEHFLSLDDENARLLQNLMNIAGYIPLFGMCSGCFRLMHVYYHIDNDLTTGAKVCYVTRAILEILGVGVLLLPVDLFATHRRVEED